ncbi:MAG: radical SAM family heme chaperone HemW [Chitinophagaceae bacterium]|nr:radical SAM family heme chaperone HemW [Chitinophagaceae bacterium]
MAGIYIHIPFCRKACSYCNFHFSTSLKLKNELLQSILWELKEKQNLLTDQMVTSVYFGGGTPSILEEGEIELLLKTVYQNYVVDGNAEITLEANPDDITSEKLLGWKNAGVNRLSIGIQSFREEDLVRMNRSHSSQQALACIPLAQQAGFHNITLDLIFGFPELSHDAWEQNIQIALQLQVPHISCYAMTVEPKTVLDHQIKKGVMEPINHEHSAIQYEHLMQRMVKAGYEHYEISSYAKPGFRAKHNSSYWNQVAYLGIGPSAHSYDGNQRSWNVAHNVHYIEQCQSKKLLPEIEVLSREQKINEFIMVRLRISEGLDVVVVKSLLTISEWTAFNETKEGFIKLAWLQEQNEVLRLTNAGKLFADHIASSFFI